LENTLPQLARLSILTEIISKPPLDHEHENLIKFMLTLASFKCALSPSVKEQQAHS